MKRVLLILALVIALVAPIAAQGTTEKPATASTGITSVTEPVTIRMWHSRGAGANGTMIADSVAEFNRTNPYGITVEQVYQGNYATTLAKATQGIAAGTNPELIVLDSAVATPYMAEEGMLVDMLPYMQRDGISPDSFLDTFMMHSKWNGQVVALPYVRSGLIFYYNADMLKAAGFEAPKTVEEMEKIAKALTVAGKDGVTERYGLLVHNETWISANWAYQMGSDYSSLDGSTSPFIYDGTLLKILKEWRRWINEGWCAPPNVTDTQTKMREMFYQGKIAMMFSSSGSMSGILQNSKFEVGVTLPPSFSDVRSTFAGGGNIAMLSKNVSANAKAAAWEFVKFLMTSDQDAQNHIRTGYLPVRKDSTENKALAEHWNKVPQAKAAFEALRDFGHAVPWCTWYSELDQYVLSYTSQVIQDGTISPEDAIKGMQVEANIIFR